MVLAPETYSAVAGTAGNLQLTVTVSPSNATEKGVIFSISPETSGLTINSNKVSWSAGVPSGVYTILTKTKDGEFTDTTVLTLTNSETEG